MDMYNNIQYYSGIEKKEILPFATTWMSHEGNMLNKLRQRKIPCHLTYMWNQKKMSS